MVNISLNNLKGICDASKVGVGLGDEVLDSASIDWRFENWDKVNIGGAQLKKTDGEVTITTGDFFLEGQQVDFVKIDVEGMEIEVLKGLARTISRYRPKLFVEVDNSNLNSMHVWLKDNRYHVVEEFQRYSSNTNLLCLPCQ